MKFLSRILLPLVVALMCLASASPALAQASKTWLPEFNPDQHVYIDSRLENHSSKPLSLPVLPAEIERAQKLHNLKIYVIATEQGTDAGQGPKVAADKLDQLVLKWRNDPNFPVDDYLVILWVRYKDDPARGSVAANGGNRLRAYGMTADHFAASDGPVIPVLKQHMRERPELALTTIINNVNGEVASAIESEKSAAARDEALKALPGFLLKWGSILAGLLLVLGISMRFFRARSRMQLELNRFENHLAKVTAFLEELKTKHGKFLKDQTGWETRFDGTSLAKLRSGLSAYGELLAIAAGASKRLAEARKAAGSHWFPRIQGSLDAIKLLTYTDITISSREIELEMATLFGGLTVNKVVKPEQIFSNASELKRASDSDLSEIESKIALVDSTVATIDGIINWCRDQKATFEKNDLSLAPYENAIADVAQELNTFKRDALRDPVALVLEAPALSGSATKIKSTIESALKLADALEAESQTLTGLVREIEQLRGTEVDYRFPGSKPAVSSRVYRLKEQGGDPDPVVHEAGGLQMRAFDKLKAGDRKQAETILAAASAKREEAAAVVQAVFKAKKEVEENGELVNTNKALLTTELDSARQALVRLKSDFLAISFPDAERQFNDATTANSRASTAYGEVKASYDKQLYMLASRQLAEVLANIQTARQECASVEERLELLKKYREESRILASAARKHLDKLGPILAERNFTTSRLVDQRFAAAGLELIALEAIVPNKVAEWVDVHARATALKQELADIESACDIELALYEETFALVGSLPADVESAYLAINDRTLQPARDAHVSAVSELEALCRAVDVPKSDWKALKERATAAHDLCETCRSKAATNDAQAHNASLNLAYCKVRSRRFAHRKHKFLTEANRLYAQASAAYAKRDWEQAQKLAVAAYKEFLKFDRQTKRRTATLVVKGAPGASSSAPPSASGSQTSSDDGFSTGVAIAIGMSMGSGNPAPTSSGGSSSSTYTPSSTPSYSPPSTPSYTSDTGGSTFTVDTGGGGFSGGSGGGEY